MFIQLQWSESGEQLRRRPQRFYILGRFNGIRNRNFVRKLHEQTSRFSHTGTYSTY